MLDFLLRIALIAGAPILLYCSGASMIALLSGPLSWGIALAMKESIYKMLFASFPNSREVQKSILVGFASSALELGVSAIFLSFLWRSFAYIDAIAFGAAVGSVEAAYLIVAAVIQLEKTEATKKTQLADSQPANFLVSDSEPVPACNQVYYHEFIPSIERWGAAVGHCASRGLVYFSLAKASLLPGVCAFVMFALVDGIAFFGIQKKWCWTDPKVANPFYLFVWSVSALELALMVLFQHYFE